MIRIELQKDKRIHLEELRSEIELALGSHAPIVVIQEPHTRTKEDNKTVEFHGYILEVAAGEEERQVVSAVINNHAPEKSSIEEIFLKVEEQRPITRKEFGAFAEQVFQRLGALEKK